MVTISEIRTAVILGAGNVAWHMGHALRGSGIEILQVYNRTPGKGKDLADSTGARFITSVAEIFREADIFILAVSDDATAKVASSLGFLNSGILVHTSGSLPMDVLSECSTNYGVIYPLQTFTKGRNVDIQNVPFLIEASGDTVFNKLHGLISCLSDHVYKMNSDDRLIMHCAAVISSNFSNYLMLLAGDILREYGLSFDLLKPLMIETVSKAFQIGPIYAQTGPAKRGNEKVMEKHLKILEPHPKIREIYNKFSQLIMQYNWNYPHKS